MYLTRLQEWVAKSGLPAPPEWYLEHMKANTHAGEGMIAKDETDPVKWAKLMDKTLAEYRHESEPEAMTDMIKEEIHPEDRQMEEEEIDAMFRRNRRVNRLGGRDQGRRTRGPTCFCCGGVGHIQGDCPANRDKHEKSQGRIHSMNAILSIT